MNNKRGQTSAILVILFIAALVGLIYVIIAGFHVITTQDGSHTGYVTAIETNGLFFKTTSVYIKTDPQASQEDQYCLIDSSLRDTLTQYQNNRTLVTIKYYNYLIRGVEYCKSGDEAIISGISPG